MWPFSSGVYDSVLTPARTATSSRRSPGTRRRPPPGSRPACSGVIRARRLARKSRMSERLSTPPDGTATGRRRGVESLPPTSPPSHAPARGRSVGSMRVNAYAAPAAGRPLAPTTIERRAVGRDDVLIEIEYAGICHSDIHTVNGDWGPQPFPVVPGHEIVGIVAEVGTEVTKHRVGDRVGVGCMVNSCGECANCRNGD